MYSKEQNVNRSRFHYHNHRVDFILELLCDLRSAVTLFSYRHIPTLTGQGGSALPDQRQQSCSAHR